MLGNFVYSNPTKVYFGEDSLKHLKGELEHYGSKIMLIYGGGAIKKIGLYDQAIAILKSAGKEIVEVAGVMPNPVLEKLHIGAEIARSKDVDLILAVGGGSVVDYAKAVSVAAYAKGAVWERFFLRQEEPTEKIIPVGVILTLAGTGSEMNGGSVITNTETGEKIGRVFGENVFPKFSILNPVYTYSLPKYQMVSGIFDTFSHIMEQYFSGTDNNVSDYLSEALMRSIIDNSYAAIKNPEDYEARSNIMWAAAWALNTLIGKGKRQDWNVHLIGHGISGVTDAAHGMTLAAVTLPYFRNILQEGLAKFKRFAACVWNVNPEGKTDEEVALAGLLELEKWMRDLDLVLDSRKLGVSEENIEAIIKIVFISSSGYKKITHDDVLQILRESMDA
jgi:alcohol dehydrogenase YqhD (iron-dependent ADH family)